MINNDVLRSIRYMLNVSEFKLVEIVKLGDGEVTQNQINAYIKEENVSSAKGFEKAGYKMMGLKNIKDVTSFHFIKSKE
jgi:uncharacterized protein YehS (DUF1456 family)